MNMHTKFIFGRRVITKTVFEARKKLMLYHIFWSLWEDFSKLFSLLVFYTWKIHKKCYD